jgi:UDP-glucuronate 4-epimerase
MSALNYNLTPFEIINLGSSCPISLKQVVELLEKELKTKAVIEYLPMQHGDVNGTYADISKARNLLNYQPRYSFEEGLHRFILSYT